YPHRLSGGMRQRVMIAIAISCEPRVLIADEPTTALDVTIQAEILDLLRTLRERHGMAVVLITHDLGVVAEQADEVAIMYAGRIVEHASVLDVFEHPLHPYPPALLRSVPSTSTSRSAAACSAAAALGCTRSRGCRWPSARVRRSGWSANRAAASRRSAV